MLSTPQPLYQRGLLCARSTVQHVEAYETDKISTFRGAQATRLITGSGLEGIAAAVESALASCAGYQGIASLSRAGGRRCHRKRARGNYLALCCRKGFATGQGHVVITSPSAVGKFLLPAKGTR